MSPEDSTKQILGRERDITIARGYGKAPVEKRSLMSLVTGFAKRAIMACALLLPSAIHAEDIPQSPAPISVEQSVKSTPVTPSVESTKSNPTVIAPGNVSIVGDSIGYGMALYGHKIMNGAVVGTGITTGNVQRNIAHWSEYLSPLTIVEMGTNDFRYKGGVKGYMEHLDKTFLPFAHGRTLCMLKMPTPDEKRSDIREGVLSIQGATKQWVDEKNKEGYSNIIYVDPGFDAYKHTPDGIHYNAKAYKELALKVVEKCQEQMPSVEHTNSPAP